MALQIRGIHHIALTVSDPTRSARFYEKILGVKADFVTDNVICIPCGSFLLCLQLPPRQGLVDDLFDENRIGLDHIGFSVASHQQLNQLLTVLQELNIPTVGIEYDPDGKSDYICFRDLDNIQVEFYLGDYHDAS
jgi:catechol 2,3-dioxygenase-like lactoylglutathione lyase family enzyme